MELRSITKDELIEIIHKHTLWLAPESGGERANLSNTALRRANLSGTNLSYANLSDSDLSGANLRRANLSYANLRGANLSNTDLRGANLSNTDLRGANLSNTDLSDSDLSNTDLDGADLSYANLRGANLQLVGQDSRGYLFWSFANEAGVVVLRAGCRRFVGIAAARAHWTQRHRSDPILHEDCLSLVDRAEHMAKARGWKLEVAEIESQ